MTEQEIKTAIDLHMQAIARLERELREIRNKGQSDDNH